MAYASPAKQREYQRKWVAARRAAFFADKKCVSCFATDDLHLHHLNPEQKVAHAIWSWSEAKRAEEIAKCAVLCKTCHVDHHARLQERHGTCKRYQAGCRCGLCKWAKSMAQQRYWQNRKNRVSAAETPRSREVSLARPRTAERCFSGFKLVNANRCAA